jgi:hypothetical protein
MTYERWNAQIVAMSLIDQQDYVISQFTNYYNNHSSQMERKWEWLPPIRELPEEVDALKLEQIEVKSFERRAA